MSDKQEVRIISVRQSWASLIVTGVKDIENRNWLTNVRGPVLIHASKTPDTPIADVEARYGVKVDRALASLVGGVVGAVKLTDCVMSHPSKWFIGRYGFVLRSAKVLPFVPMRGPQGWGFASAELLAHYRESLRGWL